MVQRTHFLKRSCQHGPSIRHLSIIKGHCQQAVQVHGKRPEELLSDQKRDPDHEDVHHEHKATFDQFEQDKKVFDKLVATYKAKLNGSDPRLAISEPSVMQAIIIDSDSDDDNSQNAAATGAGGAGAGGSSRPAVYVPGFSNGDRFWYLDLGDSSSLNKNLPPQATRRGKFRLHDVLFEVVAVAPRLKSPDRGHQFAARLCMDPNSLTPSQNATLTKIVEAQKSKAVSGHYRPCLVKNWRNLSQQDYYEKYNIEDDEDYFTKENFLFVVYEDEMTLYIPPPPPPPPPA